ncbi:AAA family ATPase [Bosea sp. LjRoot9]|uniref:AAA family ATPase n=1 Tax=Bosea sp. LjRoot9 TaxID=3342341 RepID=UPI003ECCBA50
MTTPSANNADSKRRNGNPEKRDKVSKRVIPGIADDFGPDSIHHVSRTTAGEHRPRKRSTAPESADVLARLLLLATFAAPVRNKLAAGKPLAIVLTVPSEEWSEPIEKVVGAMWPLASTIIREPSLRFKPATKNHVVSAALGGGKPVIGISSDASNHLPPALIAAADFRLDLHPLDTRILRAAMSEILRKPVPPLKRFVTGSLGWHDAISALRPGTTPANVLALLRRSTTGTRGIAIGHGPRLEELPLRGPARDWGTTLISDLSDYRQGRLTWEDISSAAVLHGPPGTGKTLFARALARSTGLPLIATSLGEIFRDTTGHLDTVIKGIAEAFTAAKDQAPSVLFFDELDSIPDRRTLTRGGRDWWTPVVTFMLTAIDSRAKGVVLVGATNLPELLDSALVRSGRFDRLIPLLPPGPEEFAGALRWHLKGHLADTDLLPIARLSAGATPADAVRMARDALRVARTCGRPVAVADLIDQVSGPDSRDQDALLRAAIHEAGHVIALLASGLGVTSVSILANGRSGGNTISNQPTNIPMLKSDIDASVVAMLGGRAAEEIVLGQPSNGASADLLHATSLLAAAHTHWGLGTTLISIAADYNLARCLLDPTNRAQIETDLNSAYDQAKAAIRAHSASLQDLVDALLRDRWLDRTQIEEIWNRRLAKQAASVL